MASSNYPNKVLYEVTMNKDQMDIIHQAVQYYHGMLIQRSPEGSRTGEQADEIEEVNALVDMSDTGETNKNRPEPKPTMNGWCL